VFIGQQHTTLLRQFAGKDIVEPVCFIRGSFQRQSKHVSPEVRALTYVGRIGNLQFQDRPSGRGFDPHLPLPVLVCSGITEVRRPDCAGGRARRAVRRAVVERTSISAVSRRLRLNIHGIVINSEHPLFRQYKERQAVNVF